MTEYTSTCNQMNPHTPPADYVGWQKLVAKYSEPNVRKGVWQLVSSFGGLFLGWILMFLSLQIGYWLTFL